MANVKYQVQEFAGGKWWSVRSYDNKQDAKEHAAKLPKSRVVACQ